jgi:urease accessory protein
MLIARTRAPDGAPAPSLALVQTFEQRSRSRLAATLEGGEPIGLDLPRGTVLRGGDRLLADDGRVVDVRAADEDVMDAHCPDAATLARVAYHLGNRHAAVEVREHVVRFTADGVLATMCARLGARIASVRAPFEPEAGAYAAGHHAHSGEARHAGIIHDMIERARR